MPESPNPYEAPRTDSAVVLTSPRRRFWMAVGVVEALLGFATLFVAARAIDGEPQGYVRALGLGAAAVVTLSAANDVLRKGRTWTWHHLVPLFLVASYLLGRLR